MEPTSSGQPRRLPLRKNNAQEFRESGTDVPVGNAASARSTQALRRFIEASAIHTLIRQRLPTPSCRGGSSAFDDRPSRYVCSDAKVCARGCAGFPKSALPPDRKGDVGFRVKSRPSADSRRGTQRRALGFEPMSESGQQYALAVARNRVWNAPMTRRSCLVVGNAAVSVPSNAPN
jgi:hypothetical protein